MPPQSKYKKYFRMRRENKPVKTIFKRHSQAKKNPTKADVNKKAITTLSRQVKTLQLNRYGDRQYQFQIARMVPDSVPGTGPTLKNPVFFCASSFFNSEPMYRGAVDANGNATYSQVGTAPSNVVAFEKPLFETDLKNEYQWVEQQANKNTISRIEYLPLYMNHKFRFRGVITNRDQNLRYRITFFKTKNVPMQSNIKNFTMPAAAGAYWYMCSDNLQERNHFSKSYHEVISDKFITIKSPDTTTIQYQQGATPNLVQRSVDQEYNFRYTFKTDKPYKPNLGNNPGNQKFWTNVPENELIWCLISSNIDVNGNTQALQPAITIERSLGWRDDQGTTPNQGP